ncbi:hypothetical protein F511_42183 [Dorcoceras hygrometricum]|uniref:Uncharacterized protein n=1 Tax=Dorcoceras hygrometricum TaxID=472368 RepID=A0A2Z7DCD5_9LAMI|nr:hypothetical protein F511_42183 [Dorcoceras hygrometricum]
MAKNPRIQLQETVQLQDREEDDEDEAISLCDFILNSEEKDPAHTQEDRGRRTSSDPSDNFFEFFNDLTSEMCHAEDMIFCGKLVPYKNKKPVPLDTLNDSSRRYCESLPDQLLTPNRTRTDTGTRFMRSCRSLDYDKPCRDPSLAVKSEGSCVPRFRLRKPVKFVVWKPRWYGLMFGVVKSPPEMDLRDMKNRQVRRNSGGISWPATEGRVRIPANRRNSWSDDFLNVLSCKNDASVATMASSSLSLVP